MTIYVVYTKNWDCVFANKKKAEKVAKNHNGYIKKKEW